MPGFHWTKVVLALVMLQLASHKLQDILQYMLINSSNITYKQLFLVFLLHFSVTLPQNTTGVTTATTMATAGRNRPLSITPHEALRSALMR
jgi:hypothetical protein